MARSHPDTIAQAGGKRQNMGAKISGRDIFLPPVSAFRNVFHFHAQFLFFLLNRH